MPESESEFAGYTLLVLAAKYLIRSMSRGPTSE